MMKVTILAIFFLATITDALAGDLIEAAIESGQLTRIVKAVDDAGLAPRFRNIPSVTIFAPSDQVFNQIEQAKLDSLRKRDKVKILSRHTIIGKKYEKDDIPIGKVKTLGREEILLSKTQDGKVQVTYNGITATVIQADNIASNGVIHIIDKILLSATEIKKLLN